MAQPAAARRRKRRGRARKSPAFHVSVFNCMPEPWELWEPWERDWAELPADVISCILHKLTVAELLLGGVAEVCRSWRRVAREEPELWRHIDMRSLTTIPHFSWVATRINVMRSALRLSAGQCRTFLGNYLDANNFMLLAQRAPSLKSIHLSDCYHIVLNGAFANGIKNLPRLEELMLEDCFADQKVLQLVAQVCPYLKHFTLVQRNRYRCYRIKCDDHLKGFAIARMHRLHSLILVGTDLGNEGLTSIIDNCPHLEYLNLHDCRNIAMDGNLTAKCARIMVCYDDYVPPSEPYRFCFSPNSWFIGLSHDDYDYDDYHDLSLYSYLGDRIDRANLEEYERVLDVKSMRWYLG